MRLVRVKAPQGKWRDVARLAFEAGVPQVSLHQQQTLKEDGQEETKDVIDVETGGCQIVCVYGHTEGKLRLAERNSRDAIFTRTWSGRRDSLAVNWCCPSPFACCSPAAAQLRRWAA